MTGAMTADSGLGPKTPNFNYVPINLRIGYTCQDTNWTGIMRGCFEPMFEITSGVVWDGFGDYFVGPSLLLRYNYIQPNARLIPYLQCGAGFVFTDAHVDPYEHAIGQEFEFALQASAGLRRMIKPNLSFEAEFKYMHISNANLAPRNEGINAIGGMVGFTYYFQKPH